MANPVKVIKGAAKMAKLGARSMVDEKMKKKPNKIIGKVTKHYREGGRAIGGPDVKVGGKKVSVTEYMTGNKVKGKARKVIDNAQRVETEALGVSRRKSLPKYSPKEFRIMKSRTAKPSTPKVPTKTKGK